mgnify:CR=1 FL=1
MKKKILIMAMIAAMSVTALAGCGSDADTSSDTTTSNVTTTSDDTTSSDIKVEFPLAGENNSVVTVKTIKKSAFEGAESINNLNLNYIELVAETVDLLNQAADVIKEIGEIEQTDFTDEDEALQLVDSMSKIADGLAAVAGVDAE